MRHKRRARRCPPGFVPALPFRPPPPRVLSPPASAPLEPAVSATPPHGPHDAGDHTVGVDVAGNFVFGHSEGAKFPCARANTLETREVSGLRAEDAALCARLSATVPHLSAPERPDVATRPPLAKGPFGDGETRTRPRLIAAQGTGTKRAEFRR